MSLLKTPLNAAHKKLNARMVDFGGWEMPVMYTNPLEEHHTVREAVGIFDVSHMGEIMVKGRDAFNLIQKVFSKDITDMPEGKMLLGVLCNEQGGIIDDLTVYKFNNESYLLVVNAGTCPGDYQWVLEHSKGMAVTVENVSDVITKIDIQGPKAQAVLQKLTPTELNEIKRYWFKEIEVDGVPMIVSRSGYTGEDGFELYFSNDKAEQIWDRLLAMGQSEGIRPCGLGARDTLRTECGMMLYGHDIDTEHTPLEAVYAWVVSENKDFVGSVVLKKQKAEGTERKLVGFEMIDRGIARQHYPIYANGKKVGEVTSGTPSPTLKKNIGMAYLPVALTEPGTEIEVEVREKRLKAKVVKMPFYVPAYKR